MCKLSCWPLIEECCGVGRGDQTFLSFWPFVPIVWRPKSSGSVTVRLRVPLWYFGEQMKDLAQVWARGCDGGDRSLRESCIEQPSGNTGRSGTYTGQGLGTQKARRHP